MAKIISVVNQKGGTGKSACVANLGVGLALMNQKVFIVDADTQWAVSASLGYRDCDDSVWLIPKSAEKPIDGRAKQGKEQKYE